MAHIPFSSLALGLGFPYRTWNPMLFCQSLINGVFSQHQLLEISRKDTELRVGHYLSFLDPTDLHPRFCPFVKHLIFYIRE